MYNWVENNHLCPEHVETTDHFCSSKGTIHLQSKIAISATNDGCKIPKGQIVYGPHLRDLHLQAFL